MFSFKGCTSSNWIFKCFRCLCLLFRG